VDDDSPDASTDVRLDRDLLYHQLARHLRVTHGNEIAPGTPNRRRLTVELHNRLHAEGHAGHSLEDFEAPEVI
jgi:hypothetical protein